MLGAAARRIVHLIRKPRNNADECHCAETRRDGAFRAICVVAPLARGACHGRRVASRISSRKAAVAATRDLFRGSLTPNPERGRSQEGPHSPGVRMSSLPARRTRVAASLALFVALAAGSPSAGAFCGFYVGKADAKLFNEASQVILARDGDRTVISMRNDFKGELTDFALVVPVPVVLRESQIHIGDPKIFERIDAYSAPRLAEYFDPNPCEVRKMAREMAMPASAGAVLNQKARRDQALGVTVEARYTVGEYDIVILSARESGGLETWLTQSGYHIPPGAARVLGVYIRQGLKFFVAKVNLKEQQKLGFGYLRPIQVAYESPRFMLPIRLGMVNADGFQELFVYTLTRQGRV